MTEEQKGVFTPFSTLAREAHEEFVERRSRFIGHAAPVANEAQALDFIARIRHEYADATHNVYAYVINENNIVRYSDAGEPQGTAGIPVLEVIKKNGLTNAAVVVTRYFGGILLGAGGLVRAYSNAAGLACEAAGKVDYTEFTEFALTLGYSDYNRLRAPLERFELKTDSSFFGAEVELRLAVRSDDFPRLCAMITEATAGRAKIAETGRRVDF